LGSWAYDRDHADQITIHAIRRRLGYRYWSLASYLKSKVGNAMQYVHSFEQAAAHRGAPSGLDGIGLRSYHRPN